MQMDHSIMAFLKKHRVCVIATIQTDGMPHASIVHYAVTDIPITLFFCVDDSGLTVRNVSANSNIAVVIGWSEDIPTTLQMHGVANIVTNHSELTCTKAIYYALYPHSQQYESDPRTVFLAFTPCWYRLLDPVADPSLVDFFKRGLRGKAVAHNSSSER